MFIDRREGSGENFLGLFKTNKMKASLKAKYSLSIIPTDLEGFFSSEQSLRMIILEIRI